MLIKRDVKGQTLVLYAIVIVVLFAVAGLLIDGGQAYMHRRTAQAAADAGALAGAYDLCINDASQQHAIDTAVNYAQAQNPTDSSTATYQDGKFTVTTTIQRPPFFMQVLGVSQVNVSAAAEAGCYYPGSGQDILPVAWSCRDNISGGQSSSDDCRINILDWETQLLPMITGSPSTVDVLGTAAEAAANGGTDLGGGMIRIHTPFNFSARFLSKYLYVVMDSGTTANETCMPPFGTGTINCDVDGDNKVDLLGSGDRSWLDLNGGGGGASSLRDWIHYGYAPGLPIHIWVSGASGVEASTFQAVEDYQCNWCKVALASRQIVVGVPVFNATCTTRNPLTNQACKDYAHRPPFELTDTDTVVHLSGNNEIYYHVAGFARFYISCVFSGGQQVCPGHAWAETAGMKDNMKTIEGYFVGGYGGDEFTGTGGVDVGTTIISLVNPQDTD
jgi:hypothetical protein